MEVEVPGSTEDQKFPWEGLLVKNAYLFTQLTPSEQSAIAQALSDHIYGGAGTRCN